MSGYPGNYNQYQQGGFPQPGFPQPNYGQPPPPQDQYDRGFPGGPPPFPSHSPQPPYGGGNFPGPQYGGGGGGYDGGNQWGGGPGGFPSPNHGGYQPPPPPQNNNYQPSYNQGGFPHPAHIQEQQYAPPPGMPSYHQGGGPPPPMSYNHPGPLPNQPSRIGPPQYQGGQYAVHTQPQGQGQGGIQYSNCSGKRKALSIGINYTGTSNALSGCINDSKNITKFLCERYNFKQDDIVILTDSPQSGPRDLPTKANIIRAMQWLVRDARPNDSLFFHYSGHGGQTKDTDGDEDDGFDETIYPLDFKQAGQLVDDEMHNIMVRSLPMGCRLTAIFDSCHSGSALDLPYIYSTQGKLKGPNLLGDVGSGAMSAIQSYMKGNTSGAIGALTGMGKKLMSNNSGAAQKSKADKASNADVISWSGCKDSQTSADTTEAGKATGAMSWAFIAALTKYPQQSYLQLLNTIRDELKGRYDQKPQLSCAHEMDINLLFVI